MDINVLQICEGKIVSCAQLNFTPWESGSMAENILNLRTKWLLMGCFMPHVFYPEGKSTWHSLDGP
jgi:hypothetical protein